MCAKYRQYVEKDISQTVSQQWPYDSCNINYEYHTSLSTFWNHKGNDPITQHILDDFLSQSSKIMFPGDRRMIASIDLHLHSRGVRNLGVNQSKDSDFLVNRLEGNNTHVLLRALNLSKILSVWTSVADCEVTGSTSTESVNSANGISLPKTRLLLKLMCLFEWLITLIIGKWWASITVAKSTKSVSGLRL